MAWCVMVGPMGASDYYQSVKQDKPPYDHLLVGARPHWCHQIHRGYAARPALAQCAQRACTPLTPFPLPLPPPHPAATARAAALLHSSHAAPTPCARALPPLLAHPPSRELPPCFHAPPPAATARAAALLRSRAPPSARASTLPPCFHAHPSIPPPQRVLPRCFTEVMLRLVNPARAVLPGLFKSGPKGEASLVSLAPGPPLLRRAPRLAASLLLGVVTRRRGAAA